MIHRQGAAHRGGSALRSRSGTGELVVAAGLALASPARGDEAVVATATAATSTVPTLPGVVVRGRPGARTASGRRLDVGVRRAASVAGGSGAELLREVPGLFASQHSGEGKAHQLFLRGFDAIHGQDVELRVDGIPVNEVSNVHGQGYADLHFLIPEVVLALDVSPGPFLARQGDFAIAGGIDVALGVSERGLLTRVGGGSFGLLRGVIAFGPPGTGRGTFAAAELARGDGFGPARSFLRLNAIGRLEVPVTERTTLGLLVSSHASRFDSAGVVRLDDLEAGRDPLETYDPDQGGLGTRHQAQVGLAFRGEEHELELAAFGVLRGLELRQNFTGALLYPEGDRSRQLHDALTVGGRAFGRRRIADRVALSLGVDLRHDEIEQRQARLGLRDGEPHTVEVDAALGVTSIGGFLEGQVEPLPRLTVRAGLRADGMLFRIHDRLRSPSHREAHGLRLGPKLTLAYGPLEPLRLFASYGQGFRSPQALSLGHRERSPLTVAHAGELGARLSLDELRLELGLAGFVTYLEDDLAFDHVSGRTLGQGPSLRLGAELVASVAPWAGVTGELSVTWVRATLVDGGILPFVPPLVARIEVEVERPIGELLGARLSGFGRATVSALGPRPLPFGETADGFAILDLSGGLALGPVGASVEVANLLDAELPDGEFVFASSFPTAGFASRVPARHLTAGRPRTLTFTVTVQI